MYTRIYVYPADGAPAHQHLNLFTQPRMAQWLSGSVGYGSKNKNMEKACYIGTCLMKNIFCLSAKVIDLAHTTLGQFAGGWDDRPTIRVGWSEGRHAVSLLFRWQIKFGSPLHIDTVIYICVCMHK